jgi:redox-sensitive bicupin YhaK (pirin superfamily)
MIDTIHPVTHDLGAFDVKRTLPSRGRTMVGPFIFVDQFGPAHFDIGAGMDVRPHPHINLATVTYLFAGAIDHRDSLGTFATIRPGAVNLMTAGKGIVHSERTPAAERAAGSPIAGMQTWLALPDGREEMDPAFAHFAADTLPVVKGDGVCATVIMGSLWGQTSPVTQHAATIYADIMMEPGSKLPIDTEADERAVIVASGVASLDGQSLAPHALHILPPGKAMTLRADSDARMILLGGEAFATPRHVWWNFVSSSRDRINAAKTDWKAGHFPTVQGDEAEFIPIPAVPLTQSEGWPESE